MSGGDGAGSSRNTFLEVREVLARFKTALGRVREGLEASAAQEERVRNFVQAMVEKRLELENATRDLIRRSPGDVLGLFVQYSSLPESIPAFPTGPLTAQHVAQWQNTADNELADGLRNMAVAMRHESARATFEALADLVAQHVRTVAFHVQHSKGV